MQSLSCAQLFVWGHLRDKCWLRFAEGAIALYSAHALVLIQELANELEMHPLIHTLVVMYFEMNFLRWCFLCANGKTYLVADIENQWVLLRTVQRHDTEVYPCPSFLVDTARYCRHQHRPSSNHQKLVSSYRLVGYWIFLLSGSQPRPTALPCAAKLISMSEDCTVNVLHWCRTVGHTPSHVLLVKLCCAEQYCKMTMPC